MNQCKTCTALKEELKQLKAAYSAALEKIKEAECQRDAIKTLLIGYEQTRSGYN